LIPLACANLALSAAAQMVTVALELSAAVLQAASARKLAAQEIRKVRGDTQAQLVIMCAVPIRFVATLYRPWVLQRRPLVVVVLGARRMRVLVVLTRALGPSRIQALQITLALRNGVCLHAPRSIKINGTDLPIPMVLGYIVVA
jgi:hypothetical protein